MEWPVDYGSGGPLDLDERRPVQPSPPAMDPDPQPPERSDGGVAERERTRPAWQPQAVMEPATSPQKRSGGGGRFALGIVVLVAGVLGYDLYRKWQLDPVHFVAHLVQGKVVAGHPKPRKPTTAHEYDCGLLAGSHGKLPMPTLRVSGVVQSDVHSMALILEGRSAPLKVKVGEYVGDTCWLLSSVELNSVTLWSPVSEDLDSDSGETIRIPVTADRDEGGPQSL